MNISSLSRWTGMTRETIRRRLYDVAFDEEEGGGYPLAEFITTCLSAEDQERVLLHRVEIEQAQFDAQERRPAPAAPADAETTA